jgi:pimeloyl-ACP methyl ester carboxylesterase
MEELLLCRVQLSIMHPRLFQSLVFIEPVIQESIPPGPNAAFMTSLRPDRWDSVSEARSQFLKNKFYKSWDRRALEKYLQYGLRDTPTALYPNNPPGTVTLTTPKAQEAWSYVRSTFTTRPSEDLLDEEERLLTADYTPTQAKYIFHRAEAGLAFQLLPYLQPAVKWIFGERSYINRPVDREIKVSRTGMATRVHRGICTTIGGAGHLIPQENIAELANVIVPYIEEQLRKYIDEQAFWNTYDSRKSEAGMLRLSKEWINGVRQKSDTLRPVSEKAKL